MPTYSMSKIFCYSILFMFSAAVTCAADTPKHLELGRLLVENLIPDTTTYSHQSFIRWKGDFLTDTYSASTDCSGLINELLDRSNSSSYDKLLQVSRKRRPRAVDYHNQIMGESGFKRIEKITDILPGDIIATKYPTGMGSQGKQADDSGHVMLVDAVPVKRQKFTTPLIENTEQWSVLVIDSSKSPHGIKDTRYDAELKRKRSGVGRGTIRIYTVPDGTITGYTFSLLLSSPYKDGAQIPIAVGRPLYGTMK